MVAGCEASQSGENDQDHENIDGNIFILAVYICAGSGVGNISYQEGKQKCKGRGFYKVECNVLFIMEFGNNVAFQVNAELPEP